MARAVGYSEQLIHTIGYRADGTITNGSKPQLVLPKAFPRSTVTFQNNGSGVMWVESGGARATATLSSGTVASCTIINAGFNYTLPPRVMFLGGGGNQNGLNLGVGYPQPSAPSNVATGHCVMVADGYSLGKKVSSIVIDNAGAGYICAPYVLLINDPNDPNGCADPYNAGAGSGVQLSPTASTFDGYTICPTDPIAVWCSVANAPFYCRYTT
jgi:hypothetical protein